MAGHFLSLEQLASEAESAVSDLLSDEEWEDFQARPSLAKIQWRYCHADCDELAEALAAITGWPVVSVASPSEGPLHRLVEGPDGRLLDIMGWTSLPLLEQRYRLKGLTLHRGDSPFAMLMASADTDEFFSACCTLLHLEGTPFDDRDFQNQVRVFLVEEFGCDC